MTKQSTVDGLVNVASGLGTEKSKREHNTWVFDGLNNWSDLDAAYQSNWIAAKVVDIPAEDATREWRRVKCEGAEQITAAEDYLNVMIKVQEALRWSRLYGGGAILMITDQDLEKPLNVNKIKKGELRRLMVFDRWDLTSDGLNTTDIMAENYMQPDFYRVRNGTQRIHWSHFAIFRGASLPRRWMEHTQGWGDSFLRKCIEDVTDTVAAKNGISELMQEANIDVIKRNGLVQALASDEDEEVIKRYSLFSLMKSTINLALLDDEETLERQTLNLSGVAPIVEQFMTWISAAADIPVTRMFGTSAKGMNATGEGDDRNYNNSLRSIQSRHITGPLRTIDEVLVRSALGYWDDSFDYTWNPLQQPNELEIAQAEQLRCQKHTAYLDAGVVQVSQVMRELQAGEEYQFDDDALAELEELESANMFETIPEPEPEQSGELEQANQEFADRWAGMAEIGFTADQISARLLHT